MKLSLVRRLLKQFAWAMASYIYCKLRQHIQQLMRSAHDYYIRDVIGASLLETILVLCETQQD